MDTTALRAIYDRLNTSAEAGRFPAPHPSEWSTAAVLAHVIATNRTLCLLGIHVLEGRDTSYEGGTLSVHPAWLTSIVQAAGDFAGLLAALRLSHEELLALASRFDAAQAGRLFPATIYDGRGTVQLDRPLSFATFLLTYLPIHIQHHIEQIRALSGDVAPSLA